MTKFCDVAVVGAGPYGLSLAAHLAHAGVNFRIFGKTLSTWRDHVPQGMQLKSDGFASNLSHPRAGSSLADYCAGRGIEYDDKYIPVPLSLFQEYSAWFQQQHVPMVEERNVTVLSALPAGGYALTLENGERLMATRVVLGVGITHFRRFPDQMLALRGPHLTHSFDHHSLEALAGKDVLVVGGGSSAVDTAVLAADAGAKVTLLARRREILYHTMPDPDAASWLGAITNPSSGIGPGWRSFFCSRAPRLFRRLPEELRLRAVRTHLGPAPGWFMRGKLEGRVKTHLGFQLNGACRDGGRIRIDSHDGGGAVLALQAEHVICATGYKSDLRSLPFLDDFLRARIAQFDHTPHLSDHFETSAPGLYVMGTLAANTFGPLMRFMVGAEYVAPRLAAHLIKKSARKALAA